jgi:hypothetical protein
VTLKIAPMQTRYPDDNEMLVRCNEQLVPSFNEIDMYLAVPDVDVMDFTGMLFISFLRSYGVTLVRKVFQQNIKLKC